jgi:hypothetical protein
LIPPAFRAVAVAHPGHPQLDDLALPLLHVVEQEVLSLNSIQAHTSALQSSMTTLFSLLEKGLVVLAHMAEGDCQILSGFFHYIRRKGQYFNA